MRFAIYLGYLAGLLTVVAFIPQVVRVWRTKQTEGLSIGTFALVITSSVAWITYGIIRKDWPVILTNSGLVVLNVAIVVAKVRFGQGSEATAGPRTSGRQAAAS